MMFFFLFWMNCPKIMTPLRKLTLGMKLSAVLQMNTIYLWGKARMTFDSLCILLILAAVLLLLAPAAWADAADELPSATDQAAADLSEPTESTGPIIIYVTEPTTEPTAPVYLEVIQRGTNSLFQAVMFGSFLICGTLVGLHLLRGRYGT